MSIFSIFSSTEAATLKVGDLAPLFETQNHLGEPFSLKSRKGLWTVLYFYPKDDTPGCTKQACAFRDALSVIKNLNADVYGISKDTVKSHLKFVQNHQLSFSLLADPKGEVIKRYGAQGLLGFAKRWTFLIDPELKIRWIQKDVDPALNAKEVAEKIKSLSVSK